MGRSTLWTLGFLFGVMVILASAFSLLMGLVVVLGSLTFIAWRGGRACLAGLFTGFGGFWLLLVTAELWAGNELDNSAPLWMLVGIMPLIAGWVLRSKLVQPVPASEEPSEPTPSETIFPEPVSVEPVNVEPIGVEPISFPDLATVEMIPSETIFPESTSSE
jgi:energy-coupling factor transporter transmembrane protein EcfT